MNTLKKTMYAVLLSCHWMMALKWNSRCTKLLNSGLSMTSKRFIYAGSKASYHAAKIVRLEKLSRKNFVGSLTAELTEENPVSEKKPETKLRIRVSA